jgi:hypothetical protein
MVGSLPVATSITNLAAWDKSLGRFRVTNFPFDFPLSFKELNEMGTRRVKAVDKITILLVSPSMPLAEGSLPFDPRRLGMLL